MDMGKEQMILDKVEQNRDQIIAFLQHVVQTPSLTGQEEAVGQAFYEAMKTWGLEEVQIVEAAPKRPNVLGKVKGSGKDYGLVFNGHMDVLPVGDEKDWIYPPFSGAIVDGTMYGRGTIDMKAGDCAAVAASGIIKQLGIPLKGDILVALNCDEEICGDLGILYLLKEGYIKGGPGIAGINCESTNMKTLDIAQKGNMRLHINFKGKSILGCRPWNGINAVSHAGRVIQKIDEMDQSFTDRVFPLLTRATIVPTTIEGGVAVNMIPDRCKLGVNRRCLPNEKTEDAIQEIQDMLDDLKKEDPTMQAEIEMWRNYRPAWAISEEEPIVKAMQKAHKYVRGEGLPVAGKEGGTDASYIHTQTGIPMPVYGPGDYLHFVAAVNENILLDDVIDTVKIYALAIYYYLAEA